MYLLIHHSIYLYWLIVASSQAVEARGMPPSHLASNQDLDILLHAYLERSCLRYRCWWAGEQRSLGFCRPNLWLLQTVGSAWIEHTPRAAQSIPSLVLLGHDLSLFMTLEPGCHPDFSREWHPYSEGLSSIICVSFQVAKGLAVRERWQEVLRTGFHFLFRHYFPFSFIRNQFLAVISNW